MIQDIPRAIRKEVAGQCIAERVRSGDTVAITAGSRGIDNIALITKVLVEELRDCGASPFVVPAMGSHGGGSAAGQRAIVEGYGVTEEYLGVPIKAGMEVVQVGTIEDEVPVFFDKFAYEADHVVVVNRVKPHTHFAGRVESGLCKMMLMGLGNHRGAAMYHKAIANHGFDRIVRSAGRIVLSQCRILMGLAVLENQLNQTALIRGLLPAEFYDQEERLLVLANQWLPRLPFPEIDLLVVDEIGKNFSGAGMDTQIVGRKDSSYSGSADLQPKIKQIYVRDLSDQSGGNATGIGIADYTHTRLVRKINRDITYMNCLTSNNLRAAAIPLHYDTDKKVLDAALDAMGCSRREGVKMVRIPNTRNTLEIMASEAYLPEVEGRDDLEIIRPLREMTFDEKDDLLPFCSD